MLGYLGMFSMTVGLMLLGLKTVWSVILSSLLYILMIFILEEIDKNK